MNVIRNYNHIRKEALWCRPTTHYNNNPFEKCIGAS